MNLFLALGSFNDISTVTTVHATERQPKILLCNSPKSVPKATYKWIIRDNDENDTPYVTSKRVMVNQIGKFIDHETFHY